MNQLGVQSLMGSSVCILQNFSEAVQEQKSLMVHYPEVGPSFNYGFRCVALCYGLYNARSLERIQ